MRIFIVLLTVLMLGCSQENFQTSVADKQESNVFTFYRNSVLDSSMRIHVATFDSQEGGKMNPDYNRAGCEEAATLYREMDWQKKNWWCEKGGYRP